MVIEPGAIPAEKVEVEFNIEAPVELPGNVPIENIIDTSLAGNTSEFTSDVAQQRFKRVVDSKVSQALIKVRLTCF